MQHIMDWYEFFTSESSRKDSRLALPFSGVVWPVIVLDIAYTAFVYKIGPRLMKGRQPFKLQRLMRYYNITQIVYNTIMSVMGVYLFIYQRPVPLGCITTLPIRHPLKAMEIGLSYLYVLNKFIDYLDTIFFVLRRSYKQVTCLHIYHHLMMTSASFLAIKYYGSGGHISSVGVLNSMIHVFMYTYYLISASYPGVKRSIWWKKYITRMQIGQFVLLLIHQAWPLLFVPNCQAPRVLCVWSMSQAIIMIYLFSAFYLKTYCRPTTGASQRQRND